MAFAVGTKRILDLGPDNFDFSDIFDTAPPPPPVGGTTTKIFTSEARLAQVAANVADGSVFWNGLQGQCSRWLNDQPYAAGRMALQYVLSFLVTGNTTHLARGKELYLALFNQIDPVTNQPILGGWRDSAGRTYTGRNQYRGIYTDCYLGYAWLTQAGALNATENAQMQAHFNTHVDYWADQYVLVNLDGDELYAIHGAMAYVIKIIDDQTRAAAAVARQAEIYSGYLSVIEAGVSDGGALHDGGRYGPNTHFQGAMAYLIDYEVDGKPLPSNIGEFVDFWTRQFTQNIDGRFRFRDCEESSRFERLEERAYDYSQAMLQIAKITSHPLESTLRRIITNFSMPSQTTSAEAYLFMALFEEPDRPVASDYSAMPRLYDGRGQGRADWRGTVFGAGHQLITVNDTFSWHHLHYNGHSFEWYLDGVPLMKEQSHYNQPNNRSANTVYIENASVNGRVGPTGRPSQFDSAGHHGIAEAPGVHWRAMSNEEYFNMGGYYSVDYCDQSTRHHFLLEALGLHIVYDYIKTDVNAIDDLNRNKGGGFTAPNYRELVSHMRFEAAATNDGTYKKIVRGGKEVRAKEILSGGTLLELVDTGPPDQSADWVNPINMVVDGPGAEDTEFLWVMQAGDENAGILPVEGICTVNTGDALVRAVKVTVGADKVLIVLTKDPHALLTTAIEVDLGESVTGYDVYVGGVDKTIAWSASNPSGNNVAITPGSGTTPLYHEPSAAFTDDGGLLVITGAL